MISATEKDLTPKEIKDKIVITSRYKLDTSSEVEFKFVESLPSPFAVPDVSEIVSGGFVLFQDKITKLWCAAIHCIQYGEVIQEFSTLAKTKERALQALMSQLYSAKGSIDD